MMRICCTSNMLFEMAELFIKRGLQWNFKNSQLNFGCAISGLALEVWNLQLAVISGTDSTTSMHI